ncbi:MAG: hypothetical protein M1816_006323 [Peltula sp. TS41687]|nr:MAG: hypothetical protein M1816_006323 [Peltula sp. TS41687]
MPVVILTPLRPFSLGQLRHHLSYRFFSATAQNAARDADFTHAVIGGGVVGLAIARKLAGRNDGGGGAGGSTVLIERNEAVGMETSSRNSEVIHAGLYYGADTLKTTLCIKGKNLLYDLCAKRSIPHRNTKKWIVAQTPEQWEDCMKIHEFARSIDVPTRVVPLDEARRREPDVRAQAGVLQSDSTGIVDSHGLMTFLQGDFEDKGGDCAFGSEVTHIEALDHGNGGYRLTVKDRASGEESTMTSETLINSAGLFACAINNMLLPPSRYRTPYFAKGSYFSYAASTPKASTLIYPAPQPGLGGLGTHLTLDMAGRIRFGPDVEWVDDPTDLTPREDRLEEAVLKVQEYLPSIKRDALAPDYCGIRPKLGKKAAVHGSKDKGFQDFVIQKEEGFEGFVNLLGIESPGLTSSLAIADMVEALLYR